MAPPVVLEPIAKVAVVALEAPLVLKTTVVAVVAVVVMVALD